MNDLEKRAAYHRKRQDGLSPFCSLGESALSDITVYNGTNNAALDYSTIDLTNGREIGLHCGTEQACRDMGYKFINKLIVKSPRILQLPFDVTLIWSSIEIVRRLAQFELFDEKQLRSLENQMRKCADAPDKYHKYSALLREFFLNKGYNVISYVSEMEDSGSTSYILLDMSIVHSDLEERFNMRLDRKSIDKNRIDIARLLGIPAFSILIHENGRFEIHNISEGDARRYSDILRNKVKDIRLIPGKYDFKKIPMPGQMPNRLVTISGMLNDSLTEGHQIQKYKGYELDWDDDNVDPEEGIADFTVHIRKNGKELTDRKGNALVFNGFKEAKKYVDSTKKPIKRARSTDTPCSAYDKSRQIKSLIDSSAGGEVVLLAKHGGTNRSTVYDKHSPFGVSYEWYFSDDFRYSLIKFDRIYPLLYRGEYYPDEDKEWVASHLGFTIEDDVNDDNDAPVAIIKYVLTHPLEETPFTDTGMGLNDFIDALDEYYGLLGINGITQKDIDRLKDEYDCSIYVNRKENMKEEFLNEDSKRKRKKPFDSINKDAGNVEHNINMFNHMNSPTGGPSNNPVSGPFGGDVSAPSSDGCCESLRKRFIEGMRLTNGMREDEHYYFDDGNYSYHFFSKADRYGITNQFAVLVVDYGFEFHYDQMYRDEKTNTDVIPTSMRHDKPKKVCYFEFDEDTQPDIVDAFLDDDMVAFRNAVKSAAEKEIEKNPLNETKLKEAATKTVYRAEYYEPKLDKWVSYYENSDVEKVKSHKDDPIFGNPKVRVSEYTVSGVRKPSYKFVKLVESVEQKEKYYMAKYRGVNTDRLHKVYFSCDGDFEDAENLLDELIAEPYTSARVLGTASKAEAERDGFTKIGGTSGTELDDDFSMSTRTLW